MNNKSQNNNQNNRNRNNRGNQKKNWPFEEINKPLHIAFSDPKELYLPNGKAYKYAKVFKEIDSSPMRKVLDGVKNALYNPNDKIAIKKMYVLVAMSAYNSGRDKKLSCLYEFLRKTINEKSVVDKDDIKAFDEFFTSVVAYHKLMHRKKGEQC